MQKIYSFSLHRPRRLTWVNVSQNIPLSCMVLNPFPHDKILDQTKLKAFADDKLNVTKMIISVFDRVENIVGIGEIACTSNFSFPQCFQKAAFLDASEGVIVWEWVKTIKNLS